MDPHGFALALACSSWLAMAQPPPTDDTSLAERASLAPVLTETLPDRPLRIGHGSFVSIDLVLLYVSVTSRDVAPVSSLGPEHFMLAEDGVPQTIKHFNREPVPLRLALVLDLSFSMRGHKLPFAADATRTLLEHLGPQDLVTFYAFDDAIRSSLPFCSSAQPILDELGRLEIGGGTALFDTALQALDHLSQERGKRVLIVVSDGEDYHSSSGLEDVVARAAQLNALVYAVGISGKRMKDDMSEHWAEHLVGPGIPDHWGDELRLRGIDYLRRLTEATGGILYLPMYTEELPHVCRHIVEDLKHQYELGYYSSNRARDGRFRRVTVSLNAAGYEARTREGYYAPGD